MESEFYILLERLQMLLRKGGDIYYADLLSKNFEAGVPEIEKFLVSNELWGGAGSIADQSLLKEELLRGELELLLVEIGRIQIERNTVNLRTEMWVKAFKEDAN